VEIPGRHDLVGANLKGLNLAHADLSNVSLWGASVMGLICSGLVCSERTSKGLHSAARSLRSVTQPVRVFELLISGNVLSTELKLVWADGTRLRILLMPWSTRPETYRKLKCLGNEGCDEGLSYALATFRRKNEGGGGATY
jgi:hypothetical protein